MVDTVELYRRRWEAEKVFDQVKNKLGEKKAWGITQEAREAQARLVAGLALFLARAVDSVGAGRVPADLLLL